MSDAPEVPVKPGNGMLEPDTFWELIEKLLLHSSRDEQKRIRHNASLSALCRGHALSRLPRDKKTQKAASKTHSKDNKSHKVLPVTKKNGARSGDRIVNVPQHKFGPSQVSDAKQTKSECSISDLDVIFLKDPEIPESERLWRFALRNRQQKQDSEINEDDDLEPVPSARSNEAIFEGLKRRLEDARKQKDEESIVTKTSKTKQKRKVHKVTKHQCGSSVNSGHSLVDIKTHQNRSKSFTNSRFLPVKAPESPLKKQHAVSPSFAHDLRYTPVKNLIETSETENSKPTPENFESKKSLYDTVLKKRLNCGNQLERLNREIVSKKMNPRLVLSRETTRKYMELKTDYLKLCYQESSLRHQIAMLQAEIYMMQNKGFHKRPAAVKTITLDSKSAHVPQKADTNYMYVDNHSFSEDTVLLFPRLKPPRPLIVPQQKAGFDIFYDRMMHKKLGLQKEVSTSSHKTQPSEQCHRPSTSFPCINKCAPPKGVCSLYSLTTALDPPPKRQPTALLVPDDSQANQIVTAHRLPKMTAIVNT